MASENKTVADIVAEMRNESHAGDESCLEWVGEKMRTRADRIEAAAKREREAGAEAAQVCGEIGEMIGREATCEKSSQVGNAAKMREALSDACYAMFNFLKTQNGGYEEMAKALDKAKAVLSAPPRNCDVGSAEEQAKRFRKFCDAHKPDESQFTEEGELLCPSTGCELIACNYGQCALAWSKMPYDEGGEK